jgi:hypothetical protein
MDPCCDKPELHSLSSISSGNQFDEKEKKNEAANDRRTFNNGVTNQMDLVADKLNGLVAKCDDDDDDEHVALRSIDMIISLTLNGGN